MKKNASHYFLFAAVLFLFFVVFTVLVAVYDVRPIGPERSAVGFAAMNQCIFQRIGVNMAWYHLTDALGMVALLFAFGFAVVGLGQLVKRKSLFRVDRTLLLLGCFYLLVLFCYFFFEQFPVNYRPVMSDGLLEPSYPSSHTLFAVCIMATAPLVFRRICPRRKKLCCAVRIFSVLLIVLIVVGRLLSGVHWFTDILGGLLLSAALVLLYCGAVAVFEQKK